MTRGRRDDPWQALRQRTPARLAIGRAGGSLPTAELLKFAMDHAEARDAVYEPFVAALLAEQLRRRHGRQVVEVRSQAGQGPSGGVDRMPYLRFPHFGRRLASADRERLADHAADECDVVLILADGLSATAANRHGTTLISELLDRLATYKLGPIVVARQARVALQDDVGRSLNAKCAVIVLGERPGLGAADSLGAYLVFDPKPDNTDADRNCVSNIRPAGLPLSAAADTIAYLVHSALKRQLSGVHLKDDRQRMLP